MEKLKMQTENLADRNFETLSKLFPNAVTETRDPETGDVVRAIDADVLRQEISTAVVEGREERYQFTWPDKKQAVLLANTPINKTLRPVREKSVGRDGTEGGFDSENIYIEGDNLDVLKLLRNTYLGKVKMIYIDPPYNTGNDFVYADDFAQSMDEYMDHSGQFDEEGNRLVQNTESNGRYHTDWLNMMYPRLKIARDLLSDDGVVFVSIDDNEFNNLFKICQEVFGHNNYVASFPRVTKRGGKSTDTYARNHDYLLAFCKNSNMINIRGLAHYDEGFKHKDKWFEKRGPYKLNQTLDYNTLQYNKTMDYPLQIDGVTYVPGGDKDLQKQRHAGKHGKHDWVWRWSPALVEFGIENGWIEVSKSGRIYTKTYLNAAIEKNAEGKYYIEYKERTRPLSTLDFVENTYSNDNSIKEISKVMGGAVFDYVKPTSLITTLIKTTTIGDDIIMDFFSGSASTAHAVLKQNAEDGGRRSFVMVQLPEETSEGTEAFKQGYLTIPEIAEERIRRAGKKIKEETGADIDYGFRIFKLDSSNMKDVYYRPVEEEQYSFGIRVDNIKSDRSPEDLLFQVMLDMGILLSETIAEEEIDGKKVFNVGDGFLIACFDENVTDETVKAIAQKKPRYAVFRDSSMANDSVMANFDQIFETYSKETVRKVL